ncbi:MAG: alpha/beta hydrolase [Phaeodactylibacter sp.]|nr:alpha/beta hydrolase [Phaeodactylibacter sp.]MCB9274019.1 alpha/beta hydrolase [Lewinellaceae bacterium]
MILFLRTAQWLFTLLALMLFLINGCVSFHTTDKKVEQYFSKRGVPVGIRYLEVEGVKTRYIETGLEQVRKLVIFVHGAPGSSNNFFQYLADSALLQEARLVSIDRLGYGESGLGHSVTSIAAQAQQVLAVREQFQADTVILVGHSYGGPIVGKYAMDYPDKLTAAVLLAPVDDPDNELMFWYAHFGKWKATRWMLPAALRVSADEKFSHTAELKKIAAGWKHIRIPVVHIHGRKDGLAPLSNIDFSRKNILPQYLRLIYLEDTGHLIPWTDYGLTQQTILQLLRGEEPAEKAGSQG